MTFKKTRSVWAPLTALVTLLMAVASGYAQSMRLANGPSTGGDQAIRPFHINCPQNALTDLKRRLAATQWPERETVTDRSQGVQLATMKALVGYWRNGYDWRKVEAKLNALPQFVTTIDGLDIHFIHVRSKHPNALPLIARVFSGQSEGLTRDDILDNITLYWLTNTAVSSARLDWESKLPFFAPKGVPIPTAVSVFPDEIYAAPKSWAERAYPKLIYYNRLPKGGHFAASEQPESFVTELRAAFSIAAPDELRG